jgi:CDP-diacylglycerol--glycerol-3-phosphate 3-phosphatidyltransferase
MRINVPNQITLARLALAVIFFVLLSWFQADDIANRRWLLHVSFWVCLVAALTDIIDGVLARMMRSVTSFGRILDPVVDKVMVCGAFVLFASHHFWNDTLRTNITDVQPWMAVVILTRELLVSAVRSHAEGHGQAFGASWVGKLKMFIQSVTVCFILAQLAWQLQSLVPLRLGLVWLTVVVTALSAVPYVHRARVFLLTDAALGGTASGPSAAGAPQVPAPPGGPREEQP